MDLADKISAAPLFEGLPEARLAELASIARERTFHRDDIIFSEGEEASGFYVVDRGRVKIFKLSPEGKEQILHLFGPGEPFGEVAVFSGIRFPAYAQALETARLVFFPRAALLELIRRTPELALGLLAVLSLRLRQFANLIEDLSFKEVPTRLAAHILYLSNKRDSLSLELEITKGQLASLLGTIPETLSRILARMTRQGMIETDGRRITILDRGLLEDLARSEIRLV